MVPKQLSETEVEFRVKATGDRLQFQWKKDCKELYDGRKYRGTDTHILRIKHVEKSDNGYYECLVKNNRGELSNGAEFTVRKCSELFHSFQP